MELKSPSTSLTARFAHGAFWNLIGVGCSRFLGLVTSIIAARLLGKAGFGAFGLIQSTIQLAGGSVGYSLSMTTTKYVAELRYKDPSRAGRIMSLTNIVALLVSSVAALLLLLGAPWLADRVLNTPHLVNELRLSSFLFIGMVIFSLQNGALSGFQIFNEVAKLNIIQALSALSLTGVMVYLFGLMGAVLALIFSTLIGIGLYHWRTRVECQRASITLSIKKVWMEKRVLFDYTLPILITGLILSPANWAARVILANHKNGLAEMGIFTAVDQLSMLVFFLPGVLGTVAIPLLSEVQSDGNQKRFAQAINSIVVLNWSLTLPIAFIFIAFNSFLIGLFGHQFHGGGMVFAIMACVAILKVVESAASQALFSSGQVWPRCIINLAWAVGYLSLGYYFIPLLGALGLALATLFSFLFLVVCMISYVAFKFGRDSIKFIPWLSLLTFVAVISAFCIGHLSDGHIMALSLFFALITILSGWRMLPVQGRKEILARFRLVSLGNV